MDSTIKEIILKLVKEFGSAPRGHTDYDKDTVFVAGEDLLEFCPFSFIKKKLPTQIKSTADILALGHTYTPYNFFDRPNFRDWFEKQFGSRPKSKQLKEISILYRPSHQSIFQSLESVHRSYEALRENDILLNGENLPIQLGEWFAKCIFGLRQIKSTSQRGFDFETEEGKRVEVKVHWSDISSPKGVKIKKSLVELSDYVVIIYLSRNFMIRDLCFLDSEFIMRRFSVKGHTVFMKDQDIGQYFFSKSSKQFVQVINKVALMTFASPQFAMKLEGRLQQTKNLTTDGPNSNQN